LEFTQDADVIIEHKDDETPFLIYSNNNNERWIITGVCNQCGKCIEGSNNPDLRPREDRLDIPVRPEITKIKECSLRGIYLDGN
jgi:hypothetical protein